MSKKTGSLIKEARTNAGLTQEQLAKKVKGLTASDISKAERGEKDLTTEQLKLIAKATGVTQKSLLDSVSSGKKTSSSSSSMKLTASEKKIIELYRAADKTTKSKVLKLLKGDTDDSIINSILSEALDMLGSKL